MAANCPYDAPFFQVLTGSATYPAAVPKNTFFDDRWQSLPPGHGRTTFYFSHHINSLAAKTTFARTSVWQTQTESEPCMTINTALPLPIIWLRIFKLAGSGFLFTIWLRIVKSVTKKSAFALNDFRFAKNAFSSPPRKQASKRHKKTTISHFNTTSCLFGKNSSQTTKKPLGFFQKKGGAWLGGNYLPHMHRFFTRFFPSQPTNPALQTSSFVRLVLLTPNYYPLTTLLPFFFKTSRFFVLENPRRRKTSAIHRHIHARRQRLHKCQRAPQIEQSVRTPKLIRHHRAC